MDEEAAPLSKDAGVICTNTVDIPHRTALIHVCIGCILKAGVEFLMLRKSWDRVSNSRFKNRYKKPKAEHQNDKKNRRNSSAKSIASLTLFVASYLCVFRSFWRWCLATSFGHYSHLGEKTNGGPKLHFKLKVWIFVHVGLLWKKYLWNALKAFFPFPGNVHRKILTDISYHCHYPSVNLCSQFGVQRSCHRQPQRNKAWQKLPETIQ